MQVFVRAAAAVALSFVAIPATAAIVADTLPYENTPAWSDVKFDGHWTTTATTSRLTTASGGIWFGWQEGTNTPSWSPASNADGHYLDLTMSLSAGARDWSAYFGDGQRLPAWPSIRPSVATAMHRPVILRPIRTV